MSFYFATVCSTRPRNTLHSSNSKTQVCLLELMASNTEQMVSIQKTAYSIILIIPPTLTTHDTCTQWTTYFCLSLLCLRLVLKVSSFSHSARIFSSSSGKEYVSGRDESISPVQLMFPRVLPQRASLVSSLILPYSVATGIYNIKDQRVCGL